MDGYEDRYHMLADALEKGDVDVRKPIGNRFRAYLRDNPEEQAKYNDIKTPGHVVRLKREFRLRWAAAEAESCMITTQTQLQEYQKINTECGSYEPLDMIVKYEGGRRSRDAWEAAIRYAEKAMQLGGQWLNYNSFTERVDILYIKKKYQQVFRQKWSLYEERELKNKDCIILVVPALSHPNYSKDCA